MQQNYVKVSLTQNSQGYNGQNIYPNPNYNRVVYSTREYLPSIIKYNGSQPQETQRTKVLQQGRSYSPGYYPAQKIPQQSNNQDTYPSNNYNSGAYNTGRYHPSVSMDSGSQEAVKRTKMIKQEGYSKIGQYPIQDIQRYSHNQDTYPSNYNQGAYNTGGYRPSVPVEYEYSQSQGIEKRTELLQEDRYNKYDQTQYLLKRNHEDEQEKKCCCCKCKHEKSEGCKKCCQFYDCFCEYLNCFCRYVGPFLRNGNT